jgi:SAM-dependent methyltransferase
MNTALNMESVGRREELLSLLRGSGIEIGALHRPCHVPHLNVSYVDRLTPEELRAQYPELSELPLVPVDVVDDAHTLAKFEDGSLDFVLANHVIEHMANPLLALSSWARVLKPGGRLFLAVPERSLTFDATRPITPWEHLVDDYLSPSDVRDFEHFLEFALHVSCRFFKVRPESEYTEFAKELWEKQYSIHYHVWDFALFSEVLDRCSTILPSWRMRRLGEAPPVIDEFIFVLEAQ